MPEKIKLKVSEILQDLKDGLTRDEIAVKYGLNKAQCKRVFQNEKLKFKKTIKPKELSDPFELEDDTEEPEVTNQLTLDVDAAVATEIVAEEVPAQVVEVSGVVSAIAAENAPEEAVDAFTQAEVELTDDTTAPPVPAPMPQVREQSAAW